MDELLATIKANAILLDSTIETGDKLNLIAQSVVNRALIYMNRVQLVSQGISIAIPSYLEVPLSEAVVKAYNGTTMKVEELSDNGQRVRYFEGGDDDVLADIKPILDKYRLATTYKSI